MARFYEELTYLYLILPNVDEEVSAGAKLRLRAAEDGKLQYILE
jgi:hypothetical protein